MSPISSIRVMPWDVPMRSPYRSAQRITTVAHNVLVVVTLADGTIGYGESAPATYVTGETQQSVVDNVRSAAEDLIGETARLLFIALGNLRFLTPGANSALEMACLDAFSRQENRSFLSYIKDYHSLPDLSEPTIFSAVTDISLPILPPDEAGRRAKEFAANGFRAFKVKVGGPDVGEDEARVRAVADASPDSTLRIDGNQGFDANGAIRFVERLSDLLPRLELFEQPTKAGDDASMKSVQLEIPVPVFADESVRHVLDAQRLITDGVCRGIVLKMAKSGVGGSLAIGHYVKRAGGVCLFGCMMETRLGMTAALSLALALGQETVPFLDLDGHLLVNDAGLLEGGLTQIADVLTINPASDGLGLRVNVA